MIDKLHIKNFLAFPELVVPELKRINLVAGKNGVGKTALLEALRYAYNSDKEKVVEKIETNRNTGERELSNIRGRPFSVNGFLYHYGYGVYINDIAESEIPTYRPLAFKKAAIVEARSEYSDIIKKWGKIALTSTEIEVVEMLNDALQINIQRISVLDNATKVLLAGDEYPVEIESLGDGARRIFLIALSMVEAKDGLLLIDEIETHLHHTVIRKLWRIIFKYAVKWDIQVVATTHSQDAIREFYYEAASDDAYKEISQVLRLQIGREGQHEVIQFPFKRLDSVMEMEMEIR